LKLRQAGTQTLDAGAENSGSLLVGFDAIALIGIARAREARMRIVGVLIEREEALGIIEIDQSGGELLLGGRYDRRVYWLQGILGRRNPGIGIGPHLTLHCFGRRRSSLKPREANVEALLAGCDVFQLKIVAGDDEEPGRRTRLLRFEGDVGRNTIDLQVRLLRLG
jgi:hypothetical protein